MKRKQYPMLLLSRNLKRLCAEKNIKQKELAEICGKERKTASSWINCVSTPSAIDIYCICKRYNLSANELLGLKESENTEADT